MSILRGVTTQSGADTFTQTAIDTNLTADGKAGWEVVSFRAFWPGMYALAAADMTLSAILATQVTTVTTLNLAAEIARVNWAIANTAGVAVAFPVEQTKTDILIETRITAQPLLYVGISSATTGAANVVYWELEYNVIKLSDVETLRLLVGGA
jgi:hypothetical protein